MIISFIISVAAAVTAVWSVVIAAGASRAADRAVEDATDAIEVVTAGREVPESRDEDDPVSYVPVEELAAAAGMEQFDDTDPDDLSVPLAVLGSVPAQDPAGEVAKHRRITDEMEDEAAR